MPQAHPGWKIVLAALLCLFLGSKSSLAADAPSGLLFDLLSAPDKTAVATAKPTFGWIVNSTQPNDRQTAYRILVASTPAKLQADTGDLWDSGPVPSDASLNIPYAGAPLPTALAGCWKVKTWNAAKEESPWSQPQSFHLADAWDENAQPKQDVVTTEIKPVSSTPIEGGILLDFGLDAFGYLNLTLDSPTAATLTVRLGEKIDNGRIDPKPGAEIRYAEITLPVQPGSRTYRVSPPPDKHNTVGDAYPLPPELGVLMPFRYAELTGAPVSPDKIHALQEAVHYPFDDNASSFTSSDPVLNQVWALCKYSIKATTFDGIYVDGDRERRPYEADAYFSQLGHYNTDREYALARFSQAYLLQHPTWPTEWRHHAIFIAWADWMYTGDTRLLEQTYDILKTKKLLLDHTRPDGLVDTKGLRDLVDWPAAERDGYVMGPVNTVVNSFEYASLLKMADIAAALGKTDDAQGFSQKADQMRAAFNAKLRDPASGLYLDDEGQTHSALHANMMPLAFGLVPDDARDKVTAFVVSKNMACSVYGAQYLLEGLYAADQDTAALHLLTSQDERSWMNMLKVGSTITLEAWNVAAKKNLDWNHAWGAAPANLIPRFILGVQPLAPGFSRVLIAPHPGDLTQVEGTVPTIRGPVHLKYANTPGLSFDLTFTIPANMIARVLLPASSSATHLTLDGQDTPITLSGTHPLLDNIGSGTHVIGYH
jgi:alpha-L-rhamnosidase